MSVEKAARHLLWFVRAEGHLWCFDWEMGTPRQPSVHATLGYRGQASRLGYDTGPKGRKSMVSGATLVLGL